MNKEQVDKTVIINRAVPGSGKTTISRCIKREVEANNLTVSIHSTDDYFISDDGRYVHDVSKLSEFHKNNLSEFKSSLDQGIDLVICDNTNLVPWEAEPYSKYAREKNYQIILIDYIPREIEKHVQSQRITPDKPDAHEAPESTIVEMIIDYFKYQKFLNHSYKIDPVYDHKYIWNDTSLKCEKTEEMLEHYDFDEILTIFPDKYREAQNSIPENVLSRMHDNPDDSSLFIKKWLKFPPNSPQAQTYYFQNILPGIVEKLAEKTRDNKCNVLISLMGFSPETTILSTVSMKPEKLIVITGENTIDHYDLVFEFLHEYKILKPSQMSLETIDICNLKNIYDVVQKVSEESNVFVDITGGKKIMSAAAAQAAWEFDATLCYIEGEYNPKLRRPKPGTESLIKLDNPSLEKAKKQRDKGIEAWEMRNFSLAEERFRRSKTLNREHLFEDAIIPLCRFYELLYNFDFSKMQNVLDELVALEKTTYMKEILDKLNIAACISVFCGDIALEKIENRIAVFLSMAQEYANQQRFDFAGLLSYRAIEALIGEGLNITSEQGFFDTANPNYALISEDVDKLEKDFSDLWNEVTKGKAANFKLPKKVSLADGFALLLVSDTDKFIKVFDNDTMSPAYVLKRVAGISSCRNQSILAHGNNALGEKQFTDIFKLAEHLAEIIFGEEICQLTVAVSPPSLRELVD